VVVDRALHWSTVVTSPDDGPHMVGAQSHGE
jgi:hypothetical protein